MSRPPRWISWLRLCNPFEMLVGWKRICERAPFGRRGSGGAGAEVCVCVCVLSCQQHDLCLLPAVEAQDQGKICVVIDLDETLVHSSFKVPPLLRRLAPACTRASAGVLSPELRWKQSDRSRGRLVQPSPWLHKAAGSCSTISVFLSDAFS